MLLDGRNAVCNKRILVFLVGENISHYRQLLQWPHHRGCLSQFAPSYHEAYNLLSRTQFDVVISQYQLPDRTAFPLLDLLAGSPATLFFSKVVENGSLWLPMLERGQRCVGASVVQPNNLIQALDKALNTAANPVR
jgi:CheY-like chemotaxis protein